MMIRMDYLLFVQILLMKFIWTDIKIKFHYQK
jgi:hypothetical protein